MIEFNCNEKVFRIDTKNTTYAMKIAHDRYLLHLHYGKKSNNFPDLNREISVAFSPYVKEFGDKFSLDTVMTELSFFDSGDMKDTAVKIKNANGDSVTSFFYKGYRIFKGRCEFVDMPYSRNADETLEIVYVDEVSGCELYSYYSVFVESDTITRYAKFVNKKEKAIEISRANIAQLDIPKGEFTLLTLCGEYAKERNIMEQHIHNGIQSIYSKRGHSSHHYNPFIVLKGAESTENKGEAYAMEFVYSGDFEAQAEKSFDGRIRLMMGLNRDTFSWRLQENEEFWTPEVILTYSEKGLNALSQNFHDHIRNCIVNPKFVYDPRPAVINTWEAMYFDINEDILFSYAESAKKLGIDMLVIDDGWFGERNNDKSSLGDWYVNRNKFKEGLQSFSEKVHKMGLKLGIWIEPEMVNPKSELYEKHPEWVLQCKNRPNSLGRDQLVLDLTNDEVVDYIVNKLKDTFSGIMLEYIKWDFNRSLSETGSLFLPSERQNEAKHRFMLGSYKMHKKLTEAFPNVIFEGCSGGGGRFDAGILFYCPQIWTSDNTDPICRFDIQKGTSLGYPLSTISAHVSNMTFNQIEKKPDYAFRFNVALGGIIGYEMNITKLLPEDEAKVKIQLEKNKKWQPLILKGDYYRLEGLNNEEYGFLCVSKDKEEFLLVYQSATFMDKKHVSLFGICEKNTYQDEDGILYEGAKLLREGFDIQTIDGKYFHRYFKKYS